MVKVLQLVALGLAMTGISAAFPQDTAGKPKPPGPPPPPACKTITKREESKRVLDGLTLL